ncbi:lysoplasmalogenase [Nocardia sp. NPDC052001]|uniref:lysoplasmalogenase n=1 Tax=Nocardia sp. NPDC052001 TaxID=3154853 RepID=UPI00342338FD
MPRPFRAAFVGAAAVTVFGAVTGRHKLQWAAKPLLMPLLAVDIATNDDGIESADRAVLLGSLAAATVGDILLIDPDNDRRLIAGASSFALMQTGYSRLWWRRGGRPQPQIAAQRLVAWLGAAALMRAKAPAVALPLTAYGATLGTAATLASDPGIAPGAKAIAGLNIPGSDPRTRLGVGALLFTVSDGLIVLRKIFARTPRSQRITEGVILTTYAAAQYLLADPRAHRP